MKYLIASDVHGSAFYLKKLIERFEIEKADKLILLGDIFNHGPRNPLPTEYNPMLVSEMLNQITDRLIVIKGNCDSEVDTMIAQFDFIQGLVLETDGITAFLTHGHVYNKDSMPKQKFDAVIYGHFHVGEITLKNDTVICNPGSISLPKDQINSYLVLEQATLTLKNLDGDVIKTHKIK